ncbi:MAG: Uma2 family endonuclease [Leptolyngbyaceae cyanobacterium SM1_1_3]|nr:Uma2 family endonuclease [Leptolyngbyaceae cyanobacterium SM1_1_3]NJN01081.1 Uma2 family endonuclease [Leptolyngbyaceae cyanobacterium RM1_1_2]NJO11487.1 Uma2 family endonuclease [Leptolyngbyaceae cyanobacterium SL_1_1]
MVGTLPQNLLTDTWIPATWEEFLAIPECLELEKARCYYDTGWLRIETMPVGSAHGQDNSILAAIVSLYGTVKEIAYVSFTNTSFRKTGERECQPDLAYYIGPDVQRPAKNNQPVDVEVWGTPALAIKVSSTTLSDDLGQKRLLYERLGVREYWVVNVAAAEVIAFAIADGGSRQIQTSLVLPDLPVPVIAAALRLSQSQDDGTVNRWLLQQFR